MDGSREPRLRVFVSYARDDGSALAEELVTALEVAGFEAYLDRHDIAGGEDWQLRLDHLIRAADTVVFLLSPASVASQACAWEVARAQELAKRILPAIVQPVDDSRVPEALRRLNYIDFRPGTSFARGLAQLADALRIDLDWVREHTRLGELGLRWAERNRPPALLLRDDELAAAQAWQAGWRAGLPAVTDAHRAFLAASQQAQHDRDSEERRRLDELARANTERAEALARREDAVGVLRRRTLVFGGCAGLLSLGLAGAVGWGVTQRERTLERHVRSQANRKDLAGQVVAYAASPGQAAMDSGDRGASPFTGTLIDELTDPLVSLWGALSKTSTRVNQMSKGQQRPFVSSDMNGDLYPNLVSPTRRQQALVVAVGRFPKIQGMHTLDGVYRDLDAWMAFFQARGIPARSLRDPTGAEMEAGLAALRFDTAPVVRPAGIGASGLPRAEEPAPTPGDTLLYLVYSGMGFRRAGVERYLAGTDLSSTGEAPAAKVRKGEPDETAPRGAAAVDALEAAARRLAAASVLVYDTQFF